MTHINLFKNSDEFLLISAGQPIFEEGQSADNMYVVTEGAVDIKVNGKIIDTVTPGGIVGEMALIESNPRSASAIARTDSRLVPVNRARFAFLVQNHPYFSIQVMQIMAARLRRMNSLW